jgi:hypothetical protein
LIPSGLVLLVLIVAALSGDPNKPTQADRAASLGSTAHTATPTATADPTRRARAKAAKLRRRGRYRAAAATYAAAGLKTDAARTRRAGARALNRSALRALADGHYARARRLAVASRRLVPTTTGRSALRAADTALARARAAARERARLARIARDQRTCTSAEKRTVRDGSGTPPGCADYAAQRAAAAQQQADDSSGGGNCNPNYAGACLKPDSPDYDCEGGSGDGPDYTGVVRVVGPDVYDLDRDGDGVGCDT